jgi:nicotinate-nucleotide adenylyltransferase
MSGRKGVFGGTFNPPHVAHLIVAHEVREALHLDQVVLVPTSSHPFKGESAASPRDRAAMTELAVAGDTALTADRVEVERGGISYTVDTLRALRQREPQTEWFLIIGRDNMAELGRWREAAALPGLAEIVVVTRGKKQEPELPFGGRGTLVRVPALEISSTAIRERVIAGRSIRYWVPPPVEAYIREHGLYRAPATRPVDGRARTP